MILIIGTPSKSGPKFLEATHLGLIRQVQVQDMSMMDELWLEVGLSDDPGRFQKSGRPMLGSF